ncbi:MAG: hypothetical protein IJV56_10210, partial [Neisseriaceae bacterium]|nr:hypothetical protein [Neisseriaceae bacterium]
GAAAAVGSTVVNNQVADYLANSVLVDTKERSYEKERNSIQQITAMASGYVIGGATAGSGNALIGANVARDSEAFNRQLHPDETKLLNKLKQGKSAEEQYRLDAAACALTHCADGVPTSDEYYQVLKKMQEDGKKYTVEMGILKQQGVNLSNGQFNYTKTDWINDKRTSYDRAITKSKGVVNSVAGAGLTVVSGVGMATGCTAGAVASAGSSCAVAATLGTMGVAGGVTQAKTGVNQVFGTYRSGYGTSVLNSLSVPTEYNSQLVEDGKNIALCGAETVVLNKVGKVVNKNIVANQIHKNVDTDSNFYNIINQIPGEKIAYNDAVKAGALGSNLKGTAGTFSGGRYATIVTSEEVTLYRVWSPNQSGEFGAYWTLNKPTGILQSKIDSALLPEWGNIKVSDNVKINHQATHYTEIKVPKGTKLYVGEVGSQGGAWVGGNSQVLFKGNSTLKLWDKKTNKPTFEILDKGNFRVPQNWKSDGGELK